MCGVAGFYHYGTPDRPVDLELLTRMTRRLAHRGPDDEGFHVCGPVGLGHRRLSIVDLSDAGHQPMSTEDGSRWIVYNGELYDHGRRRSGLEARGVRFRGTSDTETLLYLLAEHGPAALADASGIYAFAFWNDSTRTLTLGRDPLGVKPLYYLDDGSSIAFASELKALLEWPGLSRRIDRDAVNDYLHFHTPLFGRTFLEGVRQVLPGETLRVTTGGSRRERFWDLGSDHGLGDPGETVRQLRGGLEGVVADQLMSDVPTGCFFSGGIDSSAVASFVRGTGYRPPCFGVHFTGQEVTDERPFQEAAAKALDVDLHLVTLDGSSLPEELLDLAYFQDEPVIGPAMFSMDRVSRLAASHVKVCLGGQGADEIFGGYARYALVRPIRTALSSLAAGRRRPKRRGEGVDPGKRVGGNLWKQLLNGRNLRRLARDLVHLTDWKRRYFEHFAVVGERRWHDVLDPELASRGRAFRIFSETVDRSPFSDPATKVLHWDVQTYLVGLFHQDDRISMKWSLESRVPLADPRLVRFAFRVPFSQKMRHGATKWVLREAVADVLPQIVLNRKKVGFDTPAESWMRGGHAGFVREHLLSARARSRGLFRPEGVESLLDQPQHPFWFDVVWKLTCIEAWARNFLDEDRPVPGPAGPRLDPAIAAEAADG